MNKYYVVCALFVLLLTSCGEKAKVHASEGPWPKDTAEAMAAEASDEEEADVDLMDEESMPMAAEELFDDFIFNFASNKRLQLERIQFPLIINSGTKVDTVTRDEWQMESFFMQQGEYTLILDSEEQLELVKDTTVSHAVVEKIFLDNDFIRQYLFSRDGGRWHLSEVRNQTLPKNPNASFIDFYKHFVSDSVFQRESLADEMEFVGPDPDDDFAQMEGVITPDFWDAFAPELPQRLLYNVVYGPQNPSSAVKIFVLRGISNGLETEITFHRDNDRWILKKLIE